jgi:GNAT superfamily N-acetyltransferase
VAYEVVEGGWRVSDDRALLDMAAVHAMLSGSYWTPDISREQVERQTAFSSFVFGAYGVEDGTAGLGDGRQAAAPTLAPSSSSLSPVPSPLPGGEGYVENGAVAANSATGVSPLLGGTQVGFARVLTDATRFAYVCDVIVREDCRGQGLGKLLMRAIMGHPELRLVRRWMLATRDAHTLYAQFGFAALPKPEMWMQLKRSDDDGPVWR